MSRADDSTARSRAVLDEVIAAFSLPGAVDPGLAALVVANATRLRDRTIPAPEERRRRRMPTPLDRRAAAFTEPDPPPVPPAAL
ncbi:MULTISPECIES: hypothetical protein [unclassified Rathayibacter]|uniref:hypothetical protein n=1 Tax=unclassified Rathayibacter TaxID=2609250 RepID=UPI000CE7BAF5|nr:MULTISPECIES: hypothetical protein [unclassified Rathayibacter]PPI41763.1 hypothetical protein C5D50_02005 [Rathayibacter sp. RFBD1]PPI51520.1 hypothetical protein C5D38_15700 [Rathayibacter sp. TRS19]